MKGDVAVPGLMTDKVALKALTIRGVVGKQSSSYRLAISMLESRRFPFEKLASRAYPLEQAEQAIDVLAGRVPGEQAICVSLAPKC
jgi:threonine dehydrogenase-like Zn-dependent dehydrogenase